MKGQYLLPICAQVGFLAKLALEKPIELAEAQDVYAWVSHGLVLHDLIFMMMWLMWCFRISILHLNLIQKSEHIEIPKLNSIADTLW